MSHFQVKRIEEELARLNASAADISIDLPTMGLFVSRHPQQRHFRGQLDSFIEAGDGPKILDTLSDMITARYREPGCFAQALDFFCKTNDLPRAEFVAQNFKVLFPRAMLDSHKVLKYTTLLIKGGRFDDAIVFLEEQPSLKDPLAKSKITFLASTLVTVAEGTQQQENIQKLTELLTTKGFM